MIITVLSFMACYWYMSICIGLSPSGRILADLQELHFENNCSTLTLWVSTFLFTILFCYWCFCCNLQLGMFNVLLFFLFVFVSKDSELKTVNWRWAYSSIYIWFKKRRTIPVNVHSTVQTCLSNQIFMIFWCFLGSSFLINKLVR